MPNIIEVDFREAPPTQGGAQTDHIPPGRYALKVERAESGVSTTKKPMLTFHFKVAQGEYAGKRVRGNFVLPADESDSKLGLQRFHAFVLAFGAKVGERKFKLDIDQFVGKVIAADVADNTIEANGRYPTRIVSTPEAYYPVGELNKNGSVATVPVVTPPSQIAPIVEVEQAAITTPAPPVSAAETIEAAITDLNDLFKD